MNGAFYIAATGLDAQQRALDVTANNIANINTTGFKRSVVRFSDLVSASEATDVVPLPSLRAIGVSASSVSHVWDQGAIRQTGNPMDLAIEGRGFVEMIGPGGRTLLWRGGGLKINADGYLSAGDGTLLKAMISVPRDATALSIAEDGTVTATVPDTTDPVSLGQIELVTPRDAGELQDLGGGYYVASSDELETIDSEAEGANSRIVQGSLEGANLQLSDEMVTLLLVQRAYSANAQVVQAGDQIMSIINNLRR